MIWVDYDYLSDMTIDLYGESCAAKMAAAYEVNATVRIVSE